MLKKREQVLNEILETEEAYVADLTVVVQVSAIPPPPKISAQ